ncbi:MAG: tetratricopeptide repeat protein [Pseudomonadota bacterium]
MESKAQDGDAEAQFRLATILGHGACPNRSRNESLRWLAKAATAGHADAAFHLGQLYLNDGSLEQDLSVAARFFRVAAHGGHRAAHHKLGVVLLWGAKSENERFEGLYWLGAAAGMGDGFSVASLGIIYAKGMHGIGQDICLAIDWLESAALLGFKDLQDHLQTLSDNHRETCH